METTKIFIHLESLEHLNDVLSTVSLVKKDHPDTIVSIRVMG